MADRTYALDNVEIQEFWQAIASKYRAHKSYFGTDDFEQDLIPEAFFDAIEAGQDITQETWTYTVHSIEYERDSLELAVALMTVEATNRTPTQAGGETSDTRSSESEEYEATCWCPIEGFPKTCYISATNPAYVTTASYIEVASNPYYPFIIGSENAGSIPSTYELETLKAQLKIYRYLGVSYFSQKTWKLDDCGGSITLLYNVCRNIPFCPPALGTGECDPEIGAYAGFVPVYEIEYGECGGSVDWTSHRYIVRWFGEKDTIPTGEKYPIQGYDFEDAYALYQLLNP